MIAYKYYPKGFNSCTEKDLSMVMESIGESTEPETWVIEIIEITEKEYDALPEFMGF